MSGLTIIDEYIRFLEENFRPRRYRVSAVVASKEAVDACNRLSAWVSEYECSVLFVEGLDKSISVSVDYREPWYRSVVDVSELFREHRLYADVLVLVAEFNRREEVPVFYQIAREYKRKYPWGRVILFAVTPSPGAAIEYKALAYSLIRESSLKNVVDAIIVLDPRRLAELNGLSLNGTLVYRFGGLGEIIGAIVSGDVFLRELERWKDKRVWEIASLLGVSIAIYGSLANLFRTLEFGLLTTPWSWRSDVLALILRAEPKVNIRMDDLRLSFSEWASKKFEKLVSVIIDYGKAGGGVRRVTVILLGRLSSEAESEVLGSLEKAFKEYIGGFQP